jgi:hypothetical protein
MRALENFTARKRSSAQVHLLPVFYFLLFLLPFLLSALLSASLLQNRILSLSCIASHAALLRSLADPCAAACLRALAHAVARDQTEILSVHDVEVMRGQRVLLLSLTAPLQAIVAHCHASHEPLLQLRLAQPIRTILQHACVHGLRMWLSCMLLPLFSSTERSAVRVAPPIPSWFTAALAVMDDDTARHVLVATAAAAASTAAGLVARSDAALAAPCAASAAQWYARIIVTETISPPPHRNC